MNALTTLQWRIHRTPSRQLSREYLLRRDLPQTMSQMVMLRLIVSELSGRGLS